MIKKLLCIFALSNFISPINNALAQNRFLETEGVGNIIYDTTFTHGTEEKGVQIPIIIDLATMSEFSGVIIGNSKNGMWTRCNLPLKGKMGWTGPSNRQLAFRCRPLN